MQGRQNGQHFSLEKKNEQSKIHKKINLETDQMPLFQTQKGLLLFVESINDT